MKTIEQAQRLKINTTLYTSQEAQAIRREIVTLWGVNEDFYEARLRRFEYVQSRMVYMSMLKSYIGGSLKAIGYHCGRRDHSTVLHAINTIECDRLHDRKLRNKLEQLERFCEALTSGYHLSAGMIAFNKKSGNEVEGWL
jgi:chromosomal replication initiation ATPase DnaA